MDPKHSPDAVALITSWRAPTTGLTNKVAQRSVSAGVCRTGGTPVKRAAHNTGDHSGGGGRLGEGQGTPVESGLAPEESGEF